MGRWTLVFLKSWQWEPNEGYRCGRSTVQYLDPNLECLWTPRLTGSYWHCAVVRLSFAQTVQRLINTFVFIQTGSRGWQVKFSHSWEPETLPSGQVTGSCTAQQEQTWGEALKGPRWPIKRVKGHLSKYNTTVTVSTVLTPRKGIKPINLQDSPQSLPRQTTSSHTLSIQEHQVSHVLRSVNTRKAAGPDGVPGIVLKACANQLSAVLTNIFSLSLTHCMVPSY